MVRATIKRKQPSVMLWKEDLLSAKDWFRIKRIYHMPKYTILYDNKECVCINPSIVGSKRLVEIVKELFCKKYMSGSAEKLLDETKRITDEKTVDILVEIWFEWKKKVKELEINECANIALKRVRSHRLYYRARKEKEVIRELFDIGFGVYDEKGHSNWQQGAENVFMYGYMLGMEANEMGGE